MPPERERAPYVSGDWSQSLELSVLRTAILVLSRPWAPGSCFTVRTIFGWNTQDPSYVIPETQSSLTPTCLLPIQPCTFRLARNT